MGKVKDLTTGNPVKLMLSYSIPVLLGNIFQQIYNFTDTVIVGQCLGSSALAAVGTTGAMFFLVNGFVIGITSGFSVHIAQCFGAGDHKTMRKSLFNAMVLWSVITVILTAVSIAITVPVLKLMNTPDSLMDAAYQYIVIIFAGIFAPMLYNAVSCVLRAVGDSKTPLYFLILSALLNIGLDLLFIIPFKMGIAGAAWATILAQFIAGMACFVYTKKRFTMLNTKKEDRKLDLRIILNHIKIGIPMAFQFSVTAIGAIILQSAINVFGENHIAAFTASIKTEQIIVQVGISAGVTTANYVGQNYGASKYDRIRSGVWKWALCIGIAAVVCMGIIFAFGEPLSSMFIKGKNKEIVDLAVMYLRTTVVFYIPFFMIFVFRNALQAMGRTFIPLLAAFLELVGRTVVAFTLPDVIGYKGICYAGPAAWILSAVPLIVAFTICMKIYKKKGYFDNKTC
jgi:putative MATE family efflux protein